MVYLDQSLASPVAGCWGAGSGAGAGAGAGARSGLKICSEWKLTLTSGLKKKKKKFFFLFTGYFCLKLKL